MCFLLPAALAPDKGPPGTEGHGTQDGMFFCHRLVLGGLGRGAQFPVDLVGVGVGQEQVEQVIGPRRTTTTIPLDDN